MVSGNSVLPYVISTPQKLIVTTTTMPSKFLQEYGLFFKLEQVQTNNLRPKMSKKTEHTSKNKEHNEKFFDIYVIFCHLGCGGI